MEEYGTSKHYNVYIPWYATTAKQATVQGAFLANKSCQQQYKKSEQGFLTVRAKRL
jgi:hypothetical protein